MLVAFPALLFVARPAIPLRLLELGLTISFGQFAFLFCAIGLGMPAGLGRWCCRRKPLPSFLAPSSLANAYRALQLAGIALAIFGVLVLVEELGEHVPLVGFMLTLAARSAGPAAIFSKKNMSQATRPPIISLVVWERIDPGAAVYVCLVADRWPAAHAGRATPDRYADSSLLALPGVYRHPRRLWYLGLAAGALWKPGGGCRLCAGAGSGDDQRCAAAGGDAERTAARRGGADHGWLYINVFGLRLVRPGMARG